MKLRIAIAAASALMLVAAPSAFADEAGSPDGGERTPVENGYPPLPPECQPTADRTAIECTYDYGDRVDVQPAFGCWSLADGTDICVDPPEIVPVPGCNYAAGECEIVFDPEADRCVIERGTSATVWIGRAGQFYVIDWPWGADEELDAALIRNGAEFRDAIATGNVDFLPRDFFLALPAFLPFSARAPLSVAGESARPDGSSSMTSTGIGGMQSSAPSGQRYG
ncbi:MAG: hypothetical protein ACKOPI_05435, partial [bacterium]